MEIEGSLIVVGLCPVSAITHESKKNPIAFLESLKEALQKVTNMALDSYEGQVILKDKFLSHCASYIRIKLQHSRTLLPLYMRWYRQPKYIL